MNNDIFRKRIMEANIIERVHEEVNNYYNDRGIFPNSLLISYWMYDILKENYIERFGEIKGKFKIMDLDIIPILDENNMIKPINVYRGK